MKVRLTLAAGLAALAFSGIVACSGGNGTDDHSGIPDFIIPDRDIAEDNGQDTGADVNRPDVNDTVVGTDADSSEPDATDSGVDIGPADEGQPDEGQPDIGHDDGPPPTNFCNSLNDCQPYEVCDLSLGRCEERTSYKTIVGTEQLFEFRPPEGSEGDFIILDGQRLMTSSTGSAVRADINGKLVAGTSVLHSTIGAHRIVGVVGSDSGKVGVVFQNATPIYQKYPDSFVNGVSGVIDCDNSTPAKTGTAGALGDVGPYAAGYVDFVVDDMRVYYPAECGSIRRPGTPGQYPLVVIVAENQNPSFPFINFDYMGQMLATWGFVTVSIKAEMDAETSASAAKVLVEKIPAWINADLSAMHPALTGISTTPKLTWVAFGTGSTTINEIGANDEGNALKDKAIAAVAIAPSPALTDDCNPSSFLALYGAQDKIANINLANTSYGNFSSPKWLVNIKGGNHSLFTDHQMYYAGGLGSVADGDPVDIMRKDQMYMTISMLLPFLQRAFGLSEPFSGQLQTGVDNTLIKVTKG
jgi:hypothetical protein